MKCTTDFLFNLLNFFLFARTLERQDLGHLGQRARFPNWGYNFIQHLIC